MIKFFRKIRKRLLTEKKFTRYLIYAVGEIFLVVVGILIALAINNANENRILERKEQTYLKGLQEDFQISKQKLVELIQVNESNFNGARQAIIYMSQGSKPPGEKEFSELLSSTFSYDTYYNPNLSLLNEMISSGSLKDISNVHLRNRLANWISTVEDVARQEEELGIQRKKILDMLGTEDYSLRKILDLTGTSSSLNLPVAQTGMSNLHLLKSTEFENNVLMFILTSYATGEAHYKPLMKELDSILLLIDNEIKD